MLFTVVSVTLKMQLNKEKEKQISRKNNRIKAAQYFSNNFAIFSLTLYQKLI